jgi:type II secretory pathway pseudopilin PulG
VSESLEERLRQMQQEQQQSQRQRERAEQLREQAERLIRDPSEEEGQGARRAPDQTTPPELSEGGGDGERDPNTPDATPSDRESDFVPVDARDQENDASGQPIGEWYAPEGEPAPPGTNEQTAQRFRRASQEAQKAVDEQQVPRRYRHLIKEVFQRVQERADKLDGKGTIAPQGQDAVPSNQKPEGSEQGG